MNDFFKQFLVVILPMLFQKAHWLSIVLLVTLVISHFIYLPMYLLPFTSFTYVVAVYFIHLSISASIK